MGAVQRVQIGKCAEHSGVSDAGKVYPTWTSGVIPLFTGTTSLAARLFLFTRTLSRLGPQARHRQERQHRKMSIILMDDYIGRVGRQPNVVWMRHRVLLA